MQGHEIEIYKIIGIIVGGGIVFSFFIYGFVKFAASKLYTIIENDIREIKDIMRDMDAIHTKMVDNLYSKIDKINETCSERGRIIGKLEGRLNGKNEKD